MIGTTISHYRIVEELGKGGMGVVFKAEDTKLDRTVALKLLAPHMLASESDRNRFYREARAAAALHHPNIATVFEIDETENGRPFIAMEFIGGKTLEGLIAEGPLPLDKAISIGMQIAEALKAAHAKEIVHRDIKSANVMMTKDGRAKVLDFGLAKTTASTKLTQLGSTLGTVAYMSPEQTRAQEVDHRTDLWSLGAVLYEMISGRLPFAGDYEQAVVYNILNDEPQPLTAIRTGVPMELEQIVEKSLRKEARHRYQTAGGLIADLEIAGEKLREATASRSSRQAVLHHRESATGKRSGTRTSGRSRYGLVVAAAAAGLVLGGLADGVLMTGKTEDRPVNQSAEIVRSTIVLPEDLPLFMTSGVLGIEISSFDLSRDGSMLVYVARNDDGVTLALHRMDDGSTSVLEDTEDAFSPSFSPDGDWIVYGSGTDMYQIPSYGGGPLFITNIADPTGLAWLDDGFIYVTDLQGNVLARTTPEGQREGFVVGDRCNCGLPAEGPAGVGVVVSGRDQERVQWIREDADPSVTNIRGFHVQYLPSGHVMYTRTGTMHAARYDAKTGNVVENEVQLLDDIRTGSVVRSAHYGLSDHGTFVYVAGAPSGLVELVVRNPNGEEEEVGLPPGVYGPVTVSPDDRRILVVNYDRGGQMIMYDRQTGNDRVVSSAVSAGGSTSSVWFPDGKSFAYVSEWEDGSTLFAIDAETGQDRVLFESDKKFRVSGISSDGRFIAYRLNQDDFALVVRDLADGTDRTFATVSGSTLWAADWSRDDRFFSYTREGSAGSSIIVERFPPDGSSWMVSPSVGEEAEWLPDRDALVYRGGNTWYLVEVTEEDGDVTFSDPTVLFTGPYVNVAGMEYRMMSGGRALLQRPVNTTETVSRLEVITGFDRMIERAFE